MMLWTAFCFSLIFAVGSCGGSSATAQTSAESDRKLKLVQANQILAMEGLVGPFGHVSVRSENGKTFWVADHRSPSEVRLDNLVEVEVDLSAEDLAGRRLYREIFIHSALYQRRPGVGAVVHTHAPYAVALGTLEAADRRIRPTTNRGATLGTFIPIHSTIGLVDSPEKGVRLAESFTDQNGALMRGHGAAVTGETLEQAVLRAIYLEEEARSQLLARSAGEPVFFTAKEAEPFTQSRAVEHAWNYFVEKLRRRSLNPY